MKLALRVLLRMVSTASERLPTSIQWGIAVTGADIARLLSPQMHGRVLANVRQVLGPAASSGHVATVASVQWRQYARYLIEFLALPALEDTFFQSIDERVDGWEHIHSTMRKGEGVIVASAHFGNWDFAAAVFTRHYPLALLVDTFADPEVDRFVNSLRRSHGATTLSVEGIVRRAITALRKNEGIAILVDKPTRGPYVEVEFFGEPVRIPAGAAYFSRATGSPIVPCFVWRTRAEGYSAKVWPPIYCDTSAPLEEAMRTAMQQVMRDVEEIVREHPEQWYMFRSMWLPEGKRQEAKGKKTSKRLEEAVA